MDNNKAINRSRRLVRVTDNASMMITCSLRRHRDMIAVMDDAAHYGFRLIDRVDQRVLDDDETRAIIDAELHAANLEIQRATGIYGRMIRAAVVLAYRETLRESHMRSIVAREAIGG